MSGHGMNLSGINKSEIYQAVALALSEQSSGGGGGGFVAPSLVVTGSGSYTIPVGYNARVVASCRQGGSFNINGSAVLISHQLTWATLHEFRFPTHTTSGNNIAVRDMGVTAANSSANLSGANTAYNASALSEAFNVKAGTVISASGSCVYCIELYLI